MASELTRNLVIAAAKAMAAKFVEEFDAAFDEETDGDWDATAWCEDCRHLDLSDDDTEELWPVYRKTFIAETERFVAAWTAD